MRGAQRASTFLDMSSNEALADLHFTVFGFVSRPPAEVYEAVADPAQLSAYFATGGAVGRLTAGAAVQWDFADFPGAFPVDVVAAEDSERIVVRWGGEASDIVGGAPHTEVEFEFRPVDDGSRTEVRITERSWQVTAGGADAAFGNCMGWTGMLAALKAWMEHGIVLRDGFYK